MCLEESGCSVTPEMVDRLSGNNSAEKKESAMASFQDRLERDVRPRPNYRMVLIADQRGWNLCTIMDPDLSKTVVAQTGLML